MQELISYLRSMRPLCLGALISNELAIKGHFVAFICSLRLPFLVWNKNKAAAHKVYKGQTPRRWLGG